MVLRYQAIIVSVFFALSSTTLVLSQDTVTEELRELRERLAETEKKIKAMEEKLVDDETDESSKQAELKFDLEGLKYVIPGTSGVTVIFNGRIHADYWGFPGADSGTEVLEGEDPQDRVGFRRVRFGAKGDIGEYMLYKIEIEFADPDDTEWRDNYIGFKKIPWVQRLLIGNQKRPYGLDHLNSSRYNVFLERPMFIDAFNDDARRLGIAGYGVSEDQAWNWRYGVFNGDKLQDSDSFYKSDHYQGEIAARIANTAYWENDGRDYVHWAVSGTVAFPDGRTNPTAPNTARFRARPEARTDNRWIDTGFIDGASNYELMGLESVVNFGPVQFVGELQALFAQREGGADATFWGGYGYVSYFLTGEHMPWSRTSGTLGRIKPNKNFGFGDESGWGAFQLALRYSHSDLTNKDIRGGVGQNITAGLNWYFNPYSRLQINYIHGWIDESQALRNAGKSEAQYDIVGVRLMVDF